MQQTRKRVSLVIPAYNEERHLQACLESVAAQTVAPFEVIVVDNNSTDATAEIAARFPFVRLITAADQGVVFARNAGFNAAQGDIIGRIDADVVLPNNWIEHIVHFYEDSAHDEVAWSGSGFFVDVRFPRLVSWAYGLLAFRFNLLLLGHYTLWGSNMALPTHLWRKVSATVCNQRDIHEDLDLAIHVHQAGYRIIYDTRSKTWAQLRPVHASRQVRWEYSQWWPRTLRTHHKWTWPICWFFGAFLLYGLTFVLMSAEHVARWCGRLPKHSAR